MNCVMCKGEMVEGTINYPIDHESRFLLIRNVPALICEQCGEYFIDDTVFEKIQEIVRVARSSNVEIEVLRYAA